MPFLGNNMPFLKNNMVLFRNNIGVFGNTTGVFENTTGVFENSIGVIAVMVIVRVNRGAMAITKIIVTGNGPRDYYLYKALFYLKQLVCFPIQCIDIALVGCCLRNKFCFTLLIQHELSTDNDLVANNGLSPSVVSVLHIA